MAKECQWHTTINVNDVYEPVWVQKISGRKHKELSTAAAPEEENWGPREKEGDFLIIYSKNEQTY